MDLHAEVEGDMSLRAETRRERRSFHMFARLLAHCSVSALSSAIIGGQS